MSEVMNVPEGWEVRELSSCAEITNSNVDKKYQDDEIEVKLCNYMDVYSNEEVDKSINFMIATATNLEISKFELKKDDVIITKDSESPDDIGIPTYIKENLANVLCGYHLTLLRPKDICNGRFLASALQSSRYKKYFGALASGSTRFALSLGTISKLPLLLPPFKEQQKIAKILSTIDEAIEATQKLIAKEKNIKKGLMHDLLSNGIDEHGKIRTLKTHKYKESELGLIPEGWEVKTLDDISIKISDGIHSTPEYTDNSEYFFINGNNLVHGNIEINDKTKCVSEYEYHKYKKELNSSTILLSINGTIGNIAYYRNEKIVLGKSAAYIICKNEVDVRFVEILLQSKQVKDFFDLGLTGSTIKNLSLKIIKSTPIPFPAQSEQINITNILTTQDKKIETEEKNFAKLKELKKGLMDDLLSGRVRVMV